MQFILDSAGQALPLTKIESAIVNLDAAALVDMDLSTRALRISTFATAGELLDCLRQAGVQVDPKQLKQRPSECCGGCGG